MSVFAIVAALVVEQWRPLGERSGVSAALAGWAAYLERAFNGGEHRHGMVAWLVAVLPPVAVAILLHALLSAAGWVFALAFDIALVNTPLKRVQEIRRVLQEMRAAGDILSLKDRPERERRRFRDLEHVGLLPLGVRALNAPYPRSRLPNTRRQPTATTTV